MKSILFATHPDDEALFCAYTLMREKPLVVIVTDAHIQANRGEKGCDSETRWAETKKAMALVDLPVVRLGIADYDLDFHKLGTFLLNSLDGFETVYAPAIQEGNMQHDIVGRACGAAFGNKVKFYSSYAKGQWFTKGNTEIVPTEEEFELKKKMLACYTSQLNLPATAPHFEAAKEAKSEWFVKQTITL